MTISIALSIGLLVGAHIATWGMFKDSIHEGFTYLKYGRSIVIGGLAAVVITSVAPLDPRHVTDGAVLFGVTYAVERAIVEVYKTFFRNEDQGKYFIPMQFAVLGKPVESRAIRGAVGTGVVALALVLFFWIRALDAADPRVHPVLLAALVGSVPGWLSAALGAWKDAPKEGFETFKFFRSPVVSGSYAALLSLFTGSLILAALGGAGYTVATLETYKTFFFPSKPRGKFAGKPILFPEMLVRRRRFVPVFVLAWALALGLIGAGLVVGQGS